ncbi:MAG: alpha/beta fold hydrolase, partial [Actinomycetota bacterium]
PESVIGLVLISGTAGIDDHTERDLRRNADQQLAQHILDIGVNAFVDEWLAQPMFSTLPRDDEDRALRRTNTTSGLANSLITAGTGSQQPLWNRLGELRMPVLILAGTNDLKFAELAERLHRSIPTSQLELIQNAGHAVHYEQPLVVASLLQRWLNSRGFT